MLFLRFVIPLLAVVLAVAALTGAASADAGDAHAPALSNNAERTVIAEDDEANAAVPAWLLAAGVSLVSAAAWLALFGVPAVVVRQ